MTKVLVAEKIGQSGISLLQEHFDVDVETGLSREELAERLGELRGHPDPLGHQARCRAALPRRRAARGRPRGRRCRQRRRGGGDQARDRRRQRTRSRTSSPPPSTRWRCCSRSRATCPQAHASLVAGRWDRSKYSGTELFEKTLGVLGFGRIGQLVAQRARGFGMRVVGYDPYVSADRYRELGAERAETPDEVYAEADFLTIHLPKTPETEGWLNAEVFAKCKDGVRVLNVARGPLVVDEDLQAALDSGKVGGAALDVFRSEPVTEHPLFGYPNVIVTPHLGASTAEATDRAGYQAAEQVVAALTGGVVTSAVNVPAVPAEDFEVMGPFLPLCRVARTDRHRARGRRRRLARRDPDRPARPPGRARHPPARHRGPARRAARAHRGGGQRGQRARDRGGARHRASSRPSTRPRTTSPTSSGSR